MFKDDDRDVPPKIKWIMIFINRVGFPIFAFLMISVITFYSLDKLTKSLERNTIALIESSLSAKESQQIILLNQDQIKKMLERLERQSK